MIVIIIFASLIFIGGYSIGTIVLANKINPLINKLDNIVYGDLKSTKKRIEKALKELNDSL